MNDKKLEITQWVRDAIASVSPFEGVQLDVNTKAIYGTDVAGEIWWRVPMIATPEPRRLTALHEYLAEVEGVLQDERGLNVLLFVGAPVEDQAPEPALK